MHILSSSFYERCFSRQKIPYNVSEAYSATLRGYLPSHISVSCEVDLCDICNVPLTKTSTETLDLFDWNEICTVDGMFYNSIYSVMIFDPDFKLDW